MGTHFMTAVTADTTGIIESGRRQSFGFPESEGFVRYRTGLNADPALFAGVLDDDRPRNKHVLIGAQKVECSGHSRGGPRGLEIQVYA